MTPEQLKKIAEYMGYKAILDYGYVHIGLRPNGTVQTYDPLTNPEQLLELIEELSESGIALDFDEDDRTWNVYLEYGAYDGKAKTLAEAVCKAVLEMIGVD